MAFDKQFVGDLEGTSKGEMMTAEASVAAQLSAWPGSDQTRQQARP